MGIIDKNLGSILIGTWANTVLFTIELILAWRYFTRYRDGFIILGPLLLAIVVDALSTTSVMAGVYLYTITHWGDFTFLLVQHPTSSVWLFTTGFSANYESSGSSGPRCFLVALSLSSLGGTIWATKVLNQYPHYSDRKKLERPITIWLVLSAVADVTIAASLVYQIWAIQRRLRTEYESEVSGVVRKVVIRTIETGSATAAVASVGLGVYLNDPEANISVAIAYTLGRLYTISMLLSLLGRQTEHRNTGNSSSQGGGGASSTGKSVFARRAQVARVIEGIQVSHSATVHVEESVHLEPLPARRPGTAEAKPYNLDDDNEKKDSYTPMSV
ncbi:hypothetical protein T439DRAFT_357803 [Meredithblackwellia eburnea MCA 4105]